MDDALVWHLLHEVGHYANSHKAMKLSDVESREREVIADRWASSTMQNLGYSLFGVSYYLYGKSRAESCLALLDPLTSEEQSTHPSYASRYSNLIKSFDVTRPPRRQGWSDYYTPGPADQTIRIMSIAVPNKESLATYASVTTIDFPSNTLHFSKGITEWLDKTAHIYFRKPDKFEVIEYIIPDASHVYNDIQVRIFDSSGLIAEGAWPSFQFNSHSEHVKLVGDYTNADLRRDLETNQPFVRNLQKLGAPEASIKSILAAFKKLKTAERQILIAYGKGQISAAIANDQTAPLYKEYESAVDLFLGKERARL